MALGAMVILAALVWMLTSRKPVWQRYATLYTYLRDSAGLASGAPVRLNGILVGSVDRVELSGQRDPNRIVRITLKVEQNHLKDIPVDSVADISSENVLSGKYVSITQGQSVQTVRPGQEIRGQPSAELADLVKKGFDIFDSAQAVINRVDKIVRLVESGQGSIGKILVDPELYNRLVATVAEFQKVTEAISSGRGTVGKLLYDPALFDEARSAIGRLDDIIQEIQQGHGTAGKLIRDEALYNDARATIAQAKQLLEDVNAGKGTAGKLLKDEAAYRQIETILTKLDTTLDRVNSGQGTVGQLLVNSQLYDSMTGLTNELHSLVKDMRSNPKKFLRLKLALF